MAATAGLLMVFVKKLVAVLDERLVDGIDVGEEAMNTDVFNCDFKIDDEVELLEFDAETDDKVELLECDAEIDDDDDTVVISVELNPPLPSNAPLKIVLQPGNLASFPLTTSLFKPLTLAGFTLQLLASFLLNEAAKGEKPSRLLKRLVVH